MAQEMPDWSQLQQDLLVLIRRRLNLIEDFLNFGIVCKSWHSVPIKSSFTSELPRIPWLMLSEEEEDKNCRKFFSLYNGMILTKRIPKAIGKRCIESMGWLITVGEEGGEISLLHPFSGVEIELPHQNTTEDYYEEHVTGYPFTFIRKAVLSASPSHTSDYVLMVIEGNMNFLSFWRPGDSRWTRVHWDEGDHIAFYDLVCFNGYIYAVNFRGQVVVCDVAGPESTKRSHVVVQLPFGPREDIANPYILESLGSLFVVVRYNVSVSHVKDDYDRMEIPLMYGIDEDETELEEGEEMRYWTRAFRVFQVDLPTDGKVNVTETKELGDRAFFLGANSSLSVQASQFPGIKPNHIYFTDDNFEAYVNYAEGGGLDMGVCNLTDGSIQLHYEGISLSRVCPPTWVTPTLY